MDLYKFLKIVIVEFVRRNGYIFSARELKLKQLTASSLKLECMITAQDVMVGLTYKRRRPKAIGESESV